MKVAFATTDGISINEHFGRAGMFAVYEVTPEGHKLVENRVFADGRDKEVEESRGDNDIHDSVMDKKVKRMADCKIICFTNIGSPSAARLVRNGVMPLKIKEPATIEESLTQLVETYKVSPSPWLKRAMRPEAEPE
jgi:nitrogen fixation protein NifX